MPDRNLGRKVARLVDSSAEGELNPFAMAAASETEREIRACIDRFLVEIRELIRQRALEAVRAGFDAGEGASAPPPVQREAFARRPARTRSRSAPARDASPLEARIAELVLEYVELHPGIHVGGLRSGLGMSNDELRPPLRRLIEQGQLRTSGRRRGTRYQPAAGAALAEAQPPAARPARRRKPATTKPMRPDARATREPLPAALSGTPTVAQPGSTPVAGSELATVGA